ncbi:hypothetical protein [Spirosoma foliorum]|uniref:Uncharacterized protein n=1 Tax=Spirosoma foliorum TaxID=2710596 RepID=A0A7G5H5J8_9BACT|nr:hypothetical protein [Spirosoma foliorum]QMW06390.1 hypothetical protein H3H32_16605 [Spirosoma foliorum]
MTAQDALAWLNGRWWVDPLVLAAFPFTAQMSTKAQFNVEREVTIRIPTDQKTRFNRPKPQRRRFDAVAVVKPHYRAWGDELFTVGFEIKVTKSDLLADVKIADYLGYTDFMYLVVPTDLVMLANEKVANHTLMNGDRLIGILNAQSGEVVCHPARQQLTAECQVELYRELAFRSIRR